MPKLKPKILVFASGSAEGGGSGFEKLVEASRGGPLDAEIVAVVSSHANGGVRERADRLGVPFTHFPLPREAADYQRIADASGATLFTLSGWLKMVKGLNLATGFSPKTVINIHPGPLPEFGGPGLYGHHVHEAVMEAFKAGEVTHSAVTMHFVDEVYDRGPAFFRLNIKVEAGDTPDFLGARVNRWEHRCQPEITNLVAHDLIRWDGVNPGSLVVPDGYEIERWADGDPS